MEQIYWKLVRLFYAWLIDLVNIKCADKEKNCTLNLGKKMYTLGGIKAIKMKGRVHLWEICRFECCDHINKFNNYKWNIRLMSSMCLLFVIVCNGLMAKSKWTVSVLEQWLYIIVWQINQKVKTDYFEKKKAFALSLFMETFWNCFCFAEA